MRPERRSPGGGGGPPRDPPRGRARPPDAGPGGGQHVRAGVAVGHGEDVEGVDLVLVQREVGDRGTKAVEEGAPVTGPPAHCLAVSPVSVVSAVVSSIAATGGSSAAGRRVEARPNRSTWMASSSTSPPPPWRAAAGPRRTPTPGAPRPIHARAVCHGRGPLTATTPYDPMAARRAISPTARRVTSPRPGTGSSATCCDSFLALRPAGRAAHAIVPSRPARAWVTPPIRQRTRSHGPLLRPLRQGLDGRLQRPIGRHEPRPRTPPLPAEPPAPALGARRHAGRRARLHAPAARGGGRKAPPPLGRPPSPAGGETRRPPAPAPCAPRHRPRRCRTRGPGSPPRRPPPSAASAPPPRTGRAGPPRAPPPPSPRRGRGAGAVVGAPPPSLPQAADELHFARRVVAALEERRADDEDVRAAAARRPRGPPVH